MVIAVIVLSVLILTALTAVLLGVTDIKFYRKKDNTKIRVACVGDSLTYSPLTFGCFFRGYPAKLQKLLGKDYQVDNFGLNDRWLMSTGGKPFSKERAFKKSIEFEPDIVIILLGSNDSKMGDNFDEDTFCAEYERFLAYYKKPEGNPKIIICTPLWSVDTKNTVLHIFNDLISDKVKTVTDCIRKVGKQNDIPVVDLYPLFVEHKELLNFDKCHPNENGNALIAKEVYKAIKQCENNKYIL